MRGVHGLCTYVRKQGSCWGRKPLDMDSLPVLSKEEKAKYWGWWDTYRRQDSATSVQSDASTCEASDASRPRSDASTVSWTSQQIQTMLTGAMAATNQADLLKALQGAV